MIFRRTEEKDAKQVAALWEQARAYFREQKIDQWQDGYPNEESLREDMAGAKAMFWKKRRGCGDGFYQFSRRTGLSDDL